MGMLIEPARPPAGSVEKETLTMTSLNHYSTSYTQSHGKAVPWFRLGHHYGTGYSSNLRPAIYYTHHLDKEDNPQLGLALLEPQSQTRRDFQPLRRPFREQHLLSPAGQERESGYLQHRSLPPKVQMCLQTEYKGCFIPHQPPPSVPRENCVVGEKERSGFTEGESLQPNTFLPHYYPMDYARKMGRSVMRADFLPKVFLQGSEEMPGVVSRAIRETGFTRDAVDPLTSPASLLPHLGKGQKHRSTHHAASLIGKMPPSVFSGFTHNSPNLKTNTHTPPEPSHYFTHYQIRFCDVAVAERLRSGWTRGGIHTNRASAYAGRDTDRFNLSG